MATGPVFSGSPARSGIQVADSSGSYADRRHINELGATVRPRPTTSQREPSWLLRHHPAACTTPQDTSREMRTVAGYLAGFSGRTCEAYTLDLRMFYR